MIEKYYLKVPDETYPEPGTLEKNPGLRPVEPQDFWFPG
jgi:hypothetical protein